MLRTTHCSHSPRTAAPHPSHVQPHFHHHSSSSSSSSYSLILSHIKSIYLPIYHSSSRSPHNSLFYRNTTNRLSLFFLFQTPSALHFYHHVLRLSRTACPFRLQPNLYLEPSRCAGSRGTIGLHENIS